MTPDWTRNFSKFSQPTSLRRIPSHTINDDDEEYDEEEDFDHLADAQELERRAAYRNASYKLMSTADKKQQAEEEEEEEDFGDFESATDGSSQQQQIDVLSNQMESLNVNKTTGSPPPTEQEEGHLVRAVKTKEEEYLKQKHDYIDEEQEGEV